MKRAARLDSGTARKCESVFRSESEVSHVSILLQRLERVNKAVSNRSLRSLVAKWMVTSGRRDVAYATAESGRKPTRDDASPASDDEASLFKPEQRLP